MVCVAGALEFERPCLRPLCKFLTVCFVHTVVFGSLGGAEQALPLRVSVGLVCRVAKGWGLEAGTQCWGRRTARSQEVAMV